MPRISSQSSTTFNPNNRTAGIVAANRFIEKENEFIKDISKIHTQINLLADKISQNDGPVETSMKSILSSSSSQSQNQPQSQNQQEQYEADLKFLQEQRTRLKNLVSDNIHCMRNIQAFTSAVKSVRDEMSLKLAQQQQQQQAGDTNNNGEEKKMDQEVTNYEELMKEKLQQHKQQNESTHLDIQDEEMMRDCLSRLGEKVARGKRGRDDDDDEDEELMVMNVGGNTEASLKCPITCKIFEKPYKNKICKHVYDYEGLVHLIRTKPRCPVAGCNNTMYLTLQQCEEDEDMKRKVRKYLRKVEIEKALTRGDDIDADEDDEDDLVDNRMTVIE